MPSSEPFGLSKGLAPPTSPPLWPLPPPLPSERLPGPSTERESPGGFDWTESRWGMPDVALGLLAVLTVTALATGLVFLLDSLLLDESAQSDGTIELAGLGITFAFQGALFGWPFVVSKWKGRGAIKDFGFRVRLVDLAIGPVVAVAMLIASGIVSFGLAQLVGLGDLAEASNTSMLTAGDDGLYRWLLIGVVVLGAPLSEETFFRGLTLRAVQKRWGTGVGIVLSTLLFAGPHFQGGSWQSVIVLLGAISTVGAILGFLAVATGRLGTTMIAHASFNGLVTLVTLNAEWFEQNTAFVSATASFWP